MSANKITYFLSLLILTPFLTVGQKVANSKTATRIIDLADKTFILRDEADTSRTENDLNLYLILYQDSKAAFRVKNGDTIIKDNPLTWHLVGDSLYIQNSPIQIIAEGKTQTVDRNPSKYFIEKTPGGYLLKEKNTQTLWLELKKHSYEPSTLREKATFETIVVLTLYLKANELDDIKVI
ncbi:hypothetical protein GCM10027341_44180 [Spirosoma knui]